ncbi:MAG: hypothetical protein J7578_10270 [Chitinophagaceae bacterium]|nr:hypothetical protein [Chitinophagaceae bacterium]
MALSAFIQDLITSGEVSIAGSIDPFSDDDLQASLALLQQLYRDAAMDCPLPVPAFVPDTALAAAKYLYIAVQLTVLREEGEESIRKNLHLPAPQHADDVFSGDLMLGYLPQLLELAQGLAPADLLVQELRQTAAEWPLSTVGIQLTAEPDHRIILSHPALKQLYADRIIQKKDKARISPPIKELILSTTGEHTTQFWPGFDNP